MTIKTVFLKLLKIVGWTIGGALASIIVVISLWYLVTRPFYNEITSDLAKDQVVNLNKKLSADEVCIFEVGMSGIQETMRRYPEYVKDGGSDMLHEPTEYWSVVAIHHKRKTFDQYLVNRGSVILVEQGHCSNNLTLRTERSRGIGALWFAFARDGSRDSKRQ